MIQPGAVTEPIKPLSPAQIESRLRTCNPLPSLARTNDSLCALLSVEQRYTSQISDIIRNDPSLSARLLQLVNSVYFGLAGAIRGVEEAVLYVGIEQIRQLALITPVIEDFKALVGRSPFEWSGFWEHSIGTALVTREVLVQAGDQAGEPQYLAGLLHDVGKIVMASAFPQHFADVQQCVQGGVQNLLAVEQFVMGIDHCELGAAYLQIHNVPPIFVQSAAHHHEPEGALAHHREIAAVCVADHLVRHAQIGQSGNFDEVSLPALRASQAWRLLFDDNPTETRRLMSEFSGFLKRLPATLKAMR